MITMGATAAGLALAILGIGIVWTRHRQEVATQTINLVASRYLGGKRFLTLVEVDGQRLLLGLAGEQVSLVARLDAGPNGEQRA